MENKTVQKTEDIIKQLEKDGEKKLAEMRATNTVNETNLINLMKSGENDFIKKTGRRMTYSEIRQMYG
jgi:hypothetical protein